MALEDLKPIDWSQYPDKPIRAEYGDKRLLCCGGLEDLTGNGYHLHRGDCEVFDAVRPAIEDLIGGKSDER